MNALDDPTNDLDLSALLALVEPDQRRQSTKQDHGLDGALDWKFLSGAVDAALSGEEFHYVTPVRNVHRTVGTLTGSAITRALGARTLPSDHVTIDLVGSAGQSLGAFIPAGLTLRLHGDTNDYAGKGLSGGRIVVRPDDSATFASDANIIAGNVIGYGATSGEIFISGVVGERCGVRNSGATIIVEGTGDHAGEYMTGGVIVILGAVGRNLAAGMSGGTLYLYDPEVTVHDHLSAGVYEIDLLEADDDERLQALLERFREETGSQKARRILDNWRSERMNFVRIETSEYQRIRDEVERWVRSPDSWSTPAKARGIVRCPFAFATGTRSMSPRATRRLPSKGRGAWTAGFPFACRAARLATSYPTFNDAVYRLRWARGRIGTLSHQQLSRVHGPPLPRTV